MAYQSLYRRYRSQKFCEVLGQPHVTSALRSAVAEGRHGHAYLFSGPRGTGKTSTARVLAKALNCENLDDGEPCGICDSCVAIEGGKSFDLHELDAASHNKVDDVRDLISKVHLGSPGRTKVYILDEVHMLSSGAENALLKTLEEPPDHVVFVLATTEPQKVVATIRSRTQHFPFHLLPADVLAEHVRWVIADAGLDVSEDAIDYVLRQGGGSARDTLSALDLVAAAGGVPEGNDIAESLIRAIGARDPAQAIAAVQEGLELGREPRTIGEDLLELLRNAFLASMGAPLAHLNDRTRSTSEELAQALGPPTLTKSLEAIGHSLVEMRQAADPRIPLEVTLLRLTRSPAGPSEGSDDSALTERLEALEAKVIQLETKLAAQPGSEGRTGDGQRPTPMPRPGPNRRPPRRQTTSKPSANTSTGEPSTAPSAATGDRTADRPGRSNTSTAETDDQSGPQPGSEASTARAAQAKETFTEAAVTEVFAGQLDDLSQKVRARFKGGRILRVSDGTVQFGVPHPIHRDRCLAVKAELEQALSAHFGQAVEIDVVVDDASAAPSDPAKLEPRAPSQAPAETIADIGPVEELANAVDQASGGIERITQAFPGSQVIDAPTASRGDYR